MVKALQQAILDQNPHLEVDIVTPAMVRYQNFPDDEDVLVCPLTIDFPDSLPFTLHSLFNACRQIEARREWVLNHTNHKVCAHNFLGDHWLPIIYTASGPSYGEVIGEGVMPNSYHQPVEMDAQQRQTLSQLGFQLLQSIEAQPSVYLMQFGYSANKEILFDRLWPFPAAPAIASLTQQQPNLFECHWRCLTNQPITDLVVPHTAAIA